MPVKPVKFEFVRTVRAPASQVYRAFTNAMALREWLCDAATVQPRPGGRIYLAWNSGYYVSGDYVKLIENQEISFRSRGRDEPGPTAVNVSIQPEGDLTRLTLTHSGLWDSEKWTRARHEIHWGWEKGLNNLVSVLESGEDTRLTQRPMLGVFLGEYNEKIASNLGVPTTAGFRLQRVVEGMGAQAAGLQADDVVIAMNGKPTGDIGVLQNALHGCKAGDKIEVVFYRGSQQQTVKMELSSRKMPKIPDNAAKLAKKLRTKAEKQQKAIGVLIKDLDKKQAARRPDPDSWSVLEILAHLIHVEHDLQSLIHERIFDQERVTDGYADNLPARLQATVQAYPGIKKMFKEFCRSQQETIELVAALPESFTQHRGSFWRLAYELLQYPQHTAEHIAQIEAAIQNK